MSAMIGVWNRKTLRLEPGSERDAAFLGNARLLATSTLESRGIAYAGEVRIETAVLKGRDLYLGFWVDGKHYARILRDALE
jgi:hypothetical protein